MRAHDMRILRKWLILVHRYLGIAVCLLVLMWFVSGIAMIYAGGMPRLSPQERLAHMPPLDLGRVRLTPIEAAVKADLAGAVGPAVLLTIMARPAYRFNVGGPVNAFADTGEVLDEISEPQSLAIAGLFMNLPMAAIHHVAVLNVPDQWTIGQSQMPLHKITVDDRARTELYVSGPLAEVVMQTTRDTRALAWVAAIPHWLYFRALRTNGLLWTRVVLWTSSVAFVAAFLGLVLGVTQFRVLYASWMWWHYVTGAIFGVFTLTWLLSGFLSLEPIPWFARGGGGLGILETLGGGPPDLRAFPPMDETAWRTLLQGRQVKEIEFCRLQDKPYYCIRGSAGSPAEGPEGRRADTGPLLVAIDPLRMRREAFSRESLMERVVRGYPDAPIVDAQMLSSYDAYYYDRNHDRPLPVLRVKFGDADATWIYIDWMSRFAGRFTRRQRVERWVYHGFHSLDFPFWYDKRPLWDIVVIVLCAGGAFLSAIGTVIGFKRLRRLVAPRRVEGRGLKVEG